MLDSLLGRSGRHRGAESRTVLEVECLEQRDVMTATPVLLAGTLTVNGGPLNDIISITRDQATDQLVVSDAGQEVARFASASVANIVVNAGGGNDIVLIGQGVTQDATLNGGDGAQRFRLGGDILIYRGLGTATINGGAGDDQLIGSVGNDVLTGFGGADALIGKQGMNVYTGGPDRDLFAGSLVTDVVTDPMPIDWDLRCSPRRNLLADPFLGLPPTTETTLTEDEVNLLLERASAATSSNDAIIVITDRGGRILGVRVEDGVDPALLANLQTRVFAIDGAVAEARIAAFFGNNQAPLTSRTFQTTSETTLTQREIESYPFITDPNSTLRGPGFVGPLGLNDHFPRGVAFTPQVDQFAIEHTNRDSLMAVGPDNIKGTADDVPLLQRFNVNPAFIPDRIKTPGATGDPFGRATVLAPPESYGVASGLEPNAQSRGLGTLPGGIPIYKRNALGQLTQVGGIGVFFPGKTGFADEENSSLQVNYDPTKRDRSMEAEYIAFTALGGASGSGFSFQGPLGNSRPLPSINGVPQFDLPFGRIDLVGLTLDVFGPKGLNGPKILTDYGKAIGAGVVNGAIQPLLNPGPDNLINGVADTPDVAGIPNILPGTIIPEGFLVTPHASADGLITADDALQATFRSVQEALDTRAAIRLPMDSPAAFMITVTSKSGEILSQFRMPDATVFSIDVSTAKARNAAYYADPVALNPVDQLPGIPRGTAFTARTFRYLALPRFPEGIDGNPPGPFSQLNDDPTGIDRQILVQRTPVQPQDLFYDVRGTGLQVGPRAPASAFQSVLGFDAFNPATNFHDFRDNGARNPADPAFFQNNLLNRDGIVFFPGSSAIYKNGVLVGGFGISGDGVDQDDITTKAGVGPFAAPDALRADQFFFQGVRLPYQKFNRQPNINPYGSAILGSPLEFRS